MSKLLPIGRVLYAIAILGLGTLCIISMDFIIGRPPKWVDGLSLNPVLAYVSGGIIILSALAILLNQKGYFAALAIAGLILLLSISRHIPNFMNDWLNAYKSIALLGGTLIIAASFDDRKSKPLITMGCIFLAIFFIACGYAHIKFYDFVKEFIPAYVPFRGFFAYFTAICLIAGGIGILIPRTQKLAALLSGIMLAGWFVMLHIPRFLNNMQDPSDRMGLFESLAFAGIFFVLASLANRRTYS
jgi:uncharacterized membrane protein YphA (DoxX/SURF4 family)